MKVCNKCKTEKEDSDFLVRTDNGKLRNQCKTCRSQDNKQYRDKHSSKERHQELVGSIKNKNRNAFTEYMKDKFCIKCKESNRACLQFDHRDSKEKCRTVSKLVNSTCNWKKIQEEIDKCDILCANCHAKRTAIQQNWYKP